MHVTARVAGREEVDVEVGEACRTIQALKEAVVVALPQLRVEGFDVSVGGRALDDEGVVSLEHGACLDVVPDTRGLAVEALREAGREVSEAGLLDAARDGDDGLCTLYLDAGVPIDCRDGHGFTPLHLSCGNGQLLARRKTDIALRREETELAKTANRGYPWGWRPKERSAWRQAQELEEHPPRKWRSNRNSVEDVVLYMALRKWCQSLEWPAQQPAGVNGTTWLELAIDFEVSTGVRLTSHEGRLRRTMKEKATSMAHMEKSLRELYEKSKVPVHMFGGSTSRHINALSSLGIGMGALNGVTRRCVLSGGRRTEEVLDQICRSPGKKFMSSVVHLPTVDDETAMRLQLLQDEAENFCEERRQQFRAPELLGRGTVFFFDGGSRGNGRTVGAAGSGGCGFADGERTWEEHRRLTDGSSNNVAEYVALLLCLDQLVETKRRERARAEATIDIDIDIDIDGPRTNCELPGQSLSDASAVEQGSPTEPQDEGVDVDVDVDGDDGEEDGDDEEEDDEEDDEQDVEQDGEDGDRREEMSREESEEEAPQGPDRGRHASIRSGKKIRIFGDSRLVLQQVDGKWACAPQLWPYCAAAQIRVKWLEDQGHEVELLHVLRRFNKEADALANAGMDRPAEDAADFNIRPMPEDKAPS